MQKVFATRYEILRGVVCDSRVVAATLPEKPHRVAMLLKPEEFASGAPTVMDHWENVFIDERLHDWDWQDGAFKYYSHACETGGTVDVLIVYESEWREVNV